MAYVVYIPKTLKNYEDQLDMSFYRRFDTKEELFHAFATYEGEDLMTLIECHFADMIDDYSVGQFLMDAEMAGEALDFTSLWERYINQKLALDPPVLNGPATCIHRDCACRPAAPFPYDVIPF